MYFLNDYVLVGGSALALYLCHRKSEDLLYIDDIEDDNIAYLEPIESLSKEKIRDFFKKNLKKYTL
ncbi:MAG: hypothetical protein IE878_05945 [Epsilonproteobacteria bacterium]|nr:hypothetical protein [Campylobacterota bacterium]